VLSIESQVKELGELCDRLGVVPAELLTESKSAKSPGRTIFNDMMKRVYRGDITGIICWKLDRLARNPIDGSALVWALDQGKLTEIVTPTGTFRNNANDKFLMQLEFGMAKKYVDDLSDNVKRGNRAKLERGWLPCRPPLGYLNEPKERTIVPDPDRFLLVQRMWHLLHQGVSPREILRRASDEWGLRARKSRHSAGGPMSRSGLYLLFTNPFYYGLIEARQGVFQGKHEPMITEEQFWRVQELLGRNGRPRPKKHRFAYTGMIRCGTCGGMVTAEEKVNRYGYHYVYYHCTKKDRGNPCREKCIEVEELEQQIADSLSRIHVPDSLLRVGLEYLAKETEGDKEKQDATRTSLAKALSEFDRRFTNLNQMRLKDLLTDDEYLAEKKTLLTEKVRLQHVLGDDQNGNKNASAQATEALTFAHQAVETFKRGSLEEKRDILQNVGSNLTLSGKKLLIEAAKPFVILEDGLTVIRGVPEPLEPPNSGFNYGDYRETPALISQWCALVDDVRTLFVNQQSLLPDSDSENPFHPPYVQ